MDSLNNAPDREKVIAAYICSNKKRPDKRCERCPYGYEYLDQTGDNYLVWCNTARIMVDAIDLLKAQEPVKPVVDVDTWTCGNCGHTLEHQELLGDNVLFHEQYDYCPTCGKKVKWE